MDCFGVMKWYKGLGPGVLDFVLLGIPSCPHVPKREHVLGQKQCCVEYHVMYRASGSLKMMIHGIGDKKGKHKWFTSPWPQHLYLFDLP